MTQPDTKPSLVNIESQVEHPPSTRPRDFASLPERAQVAVRRGVRGKVRPDGFIFELESAGVPWGIAAKLAQEEVDLIERQDEAIRAALGPDLGRLRGQATADQSYHPWE